VVLDDGDWLDGVGAADACFTRLRQSEVAHFAFGDQFLDGAGDVLHRDVGVDPVLVKHVDVVGAQPAQ
jgi:hypothetical protein